MYENEEQAAGVKKTDVLQQASLRKEAVAKIQAVIRGCRARKELGNQIKQKLESSPSAETDFFSVSPVGKEDEAVLVKDDVSPKARGLLESGEVFSVSPAPSEEEAAAGEGEGISQTKVIPRGESIARVQAIARGQALRRKIELLLIRKKIMSDAAVSFLKFAEQGDEKSIRSLVEVVGVDINYRDEHGLTALMQAVMKNNPRAVTTLLNAGADSTLKCAQGNARQLARGNGAIEKILIDFINRKTPFITTLEDAVMEKRADRISALVAAGANVNRLDEFGITPLMIASGEGDVEMVRALLSAGADPSIRGLMGKKASDFARSEAVLQLLGAAPEIDSSIQLLGPEPISPSPRELPTPAPMLMPLPAPLIQLPRAVRRFTFSEDHLFRSQMGLLAHRPRP